MAGKAHYIKNGMGGSRNGRGRWEKTEVLKKDSKKKRRAQGKAECRE
jgi:hypothetical protein